MEGLIENCDPNDTDWSQAPLIILMDAAADGIERARKELEKRQLEMARALNELDNA
jgi:hypothetical protein